MKMPYALEMIGVLYTHVGVIRRGGSWRGEKTGCMRVVRGVILSCAQSETVLCFTTVLLTHQRRSQQWDGGIQFPFYLFGTPSPLLIIRTHFFFAFKKEKHPVYAGDSFGFWPFYYFIHVRL